MVNFRIICLKLCNHQRPKERNKTDTKDCQGFSTSLSNSSEHDSHSLCRAEDSEYKVITFWSSSVLN